MDAVLGERWCCGGGESSQAFPHGATSMSVERTIVSNVSFLGVFHKTLVIQQTNAASVATSQMHFHSRTLSTR